MYKDKKCDHIKKNFCFKLPLFCFHSSSKKFNEQKKRKSNYYKEKKKKSSRFSSSISCDRNSEPCEVQPPIENENRFISSSTESSDHSDLSLNVSIDSS